MNKEIIDQALKIISDPVTCARIKQSLQFINAQTQYFDFEENSEIENRIVIKAEKRTEEKEIRLPRRIGYIMDTLFELTANQSTHIKPEKIETDHFTLDTRRLEFRSGEITATLTEKENEILAFLYNHAPKTVSKKDLLGNIWEYADNVETHTLETHIYRLRQKIEKDPANPEILMTSGSGYKLNCGNN